MTELDAILRTIREVETSLDRRYARADGALIMVWGLVGALIFAFYQLVDLRPAPYHAALGPALPWVWLGPVAAGYVATAVVGARLGAMAPDRKRDFRMGLIPGAIVSLVAVALLLADRGEYVSGALTLAAGATTLVLCRRRERAFSRVGAAVGAAQIVVGIALVAWPTAWASGIAAAAFGIGFVALGTVRYRGG